MKRIISVALGLVVIVASGTALAEPPASSGIVVRGTYDMGRVFVDEDAGLLLIAGGDVVEWCSTGDTEWSLVTYFDKDLQDGLRLNTIEKAQVTASVWAFTDFDCDLFMTEQPLATGMAIYRMHDNDFFGPRFCEIKNNMNAWGHSVIGTLYSPSGEIRHLNFREWGLYDCDTDTFPLYKNIIRLTE